MRFALAFIGALFMVSVLTMLWTALPHDRACEPNAALPWLQC